MKIGREPTSSVFRGAIRAWSPNVSRAERLKGRFTPALPLNEITDLHSIPRNAQ